MSYSDIHRLFLQVMMSNKFLLASQAQDKYDAVLQAVPEESQECPLKDIVKEINNQLSLINLEIRKGICEVTSTKYYMLVNTVTTPINRTFKKYTQGELEVFKKVIREIVYSDIGQVSAIECMNLEVPNMSKSSTESTLDKLVEDFWLGLTDGVFYLTVRTITELEPYLKSTYKDDLSACELCSKVLFQGYRCGQCDTVMHRHCLEKYVNNSRGEVTCPRQGCRTVIPIER